MRRVSLKKEEEALYTKVGGVLSNMLLVGPKRMIPRKEVIKMERVIMQVEAMAKSLKEMLQFQ